VGTTYYEQNGDVGVLMFNLTSATGQFASIQDQMKGLLEIQSHTQSTRDMDNEAWKIFADGAWKIRYQGVGDRIDVEWDNSNVTYWDK
jgi:hypothetical protein